MSDRYDAPRWDNELEELGSDDAVAEEEPAAEVGESDLDTSSENVLDGWPAAAADDVEVAPDPDASDAAASEANALETDPPEDLPDAPTPLADHVSATMEHAPGELTVPPGYAVLEGEPTGERRAVGIVVARFNGDVTTALLESALAELDARGVSRDAVTVMPVPGAFELPLAAMALAKTRRFACIVALGCVIRGDTPHFDYVSSEAASGLQLAAIETGVPVAFGLLTLDRADQAESRYEKGAEAVRTGLEMADLFANLRAAAAR
jgi:6,7-dimethyl-8-ribityllumazine synthase